MADDDASTILVAERQRVEVIRKHQPSATIFFDALSAILWIDMPVLFCDHRLQFHLALVATISTGLLEFVYARQLLLRQPSIEATVEDLINLHASRDMAAHHTGQHRSIPVAADAMLRRDHEIERVWQLSGLLHDVRQPLQVAFALALVRH